jgi:hypothetical protein
VLNPLLLQGGFEFGWEGEFEFHWFAGGGVDEGEMDGGEHEARGGGGVGGVEGVAEDGEVVFTEMDADLMFAASVEGEAEEGEIVAGREELVVGDGAFAFVLDVGGAYGAVGEFDQAGFEGAGGFGGFADDDGGVDAFDRAFEELVFERFEGRRVFGEDEESGDIAVEAVDEADDGAGGS